MLTSIAFRAVATPKRLLLGVLAFFAVAAALGGPVAGILGDTDGFAVKSSPSYEAQAEIERATGKEPAPGVIALVETPAGATSPQGRERIAGVARAFRAQDGVAATSVPGDAPGLVSRDGRSAIVLGTLAAGADGVYDGLTERFAESGFVRLGGGVVAGEQVGTLAEENLARAELLAFPLLAVLAFFFFRGLRAAVLPVAVGLVTIMGTFLAMRAINEAYGLSVFALNVVVGLGLGLAIDYTLFLLSRFREALDEGHEVGESVRIAMTTAGRTVVFSTLTVAAAMGTLIVFPQNFAKSMGLGGATVAIVAAVASLVLTPGLLALWGHKLVPRGRALRAADRSTRRWTAVAQATMRRPGVVAGVTALAMLLVALPSLRAEWTGIDASILPPDQSARQVADALQRDFSRDDGSPIVVVGRAGGDSRAELAGSTLVILWLMTGSVVLPFKALVMNALTIGVASGVLVLVFGDGRLEGVLDYESQGGIEQTDFLVLIAIAFALSTDYGVFLLGRIKEERDRGLADSEAVARGIGRTGGLVTAAAVLMAVAIGAFATSDLIFLKQVGLGAVVAVLVDAFVVRALLVPSLMALLGRWNWWSPRPLRALHERVGLREAGVPALTSGP